MEEYCRPATLEDLKALIASLNQQGVDYLLIGGYALFAHGYHRATTDIDVLVPATEEAGRKVRKALMVLPDQAAKDIDPAWFNEGENIREALINSSTSRVADQIAMIARRTTKVVAETTMPRSSVKRARNLVATHAGRGLAGELPRCAACQGE